MYPLLRQQIEKITPLADGEFAHVAAHFTHRKLRKHQFLVEAGNLVEREFFVLSGCLKAYYPDNGKDHILQFALPDWWVTDYAAFFGQAKATIYIDCLEESEVLGITLAGKRINSFTNEEETAAKMDSVVPYLLETVLTERGAKFEKVGLWQPHVVSDQRVVTGQNPASAREVAEALLTILEKGQ